MKQQFFFVILFDYFFFHEIRKEKFERNEQTKNASTGEKQT